jgi:hypothetical protein
LTEIAKRKPREYVFCPEDITSRIIIGALQSKYTSLEILEELKGQYPVEYERYCEKDY